MSHYITPSLVLLLSSVYAAADEGRTPEHFKPLAPMLGHWEGHMETTIRQGAEEQKLAYRKTTRCRIGDDGKSIVMEDTEINPWTGMKATTTSLIRYDKTTDTFKAMVWDTEGAVRLFRLLIDRQNIVFKQIDCPEGSTLQSRVTVNPDGTLTEQGTMEVTGDNPYRATWKIRYTRTEKDKD